MAIYLTIFNSILVGKVVTMSSIYHETGKDYSGSKCVDGLYYNQGSIFKSLCHTLGDSENPWLKVDLVEEHCVMGVNLQSRPGMHTCQPVGPRILQIQFFLNFEKSYQKTPTIYS